MVLLRGGIINFDGFISIIHILVICSHVFLAPYTKVEESFSIQAIHDILTFGVGPRSLEKYDHNVFPGAVPRSFLGPLLLSIISYPFLLAFKFLGFIHSSADAALCIRLILASLSSISLIYFANNVLPGSASKSQRRAFLLLSMLQFQSPFWSGRTTPNGIISPIVNVALALIFSKRRKDDHTQLIIGLSLLAASTVIARIELVGILIPVTLCSLFSGTSPVRRIFIIATTSASTAFFSILLTVSIDTYLWGRPFIIWNPVQNHITQIRGLLWPELEAVLFNVVDGKSSDWGTSSWHAYITSHLPKLLSFSAPLFAIGTATELTAQSPRFAVMIIIAGHVVTMSLLGHKETRFILYLTPLLNLFSARATLLLWQSRRYQKIARTIVLFCLLGTAILTLISLRASVGNYPGGEAVRYLHQQRESQNTTVHVDVLPAMTGVNLFQSIHLARPDHAFGVTALPSVLTNHQSDIRWTYDKTEDLNDTERQSWEQFDFILSEDSSCHISELFETFSEDQFAEFAGISIKHPKVWLAALGDALSICSSSKILSWSCFDALLPLHFKWRTVVWLCKRQKAYNT